MLNCLLSGVGGQGTVLASRLIAQAAMNQGLEVRTAETIGMAQRGGCVVSHVRVGEQIYSSLIPKGKADLIMGFEPAETVRCLPYLKEGGNVVTAIKGIHPVTSSLSSRSYDPKEMVEYLEGNVPKLILIDGEEICQKCGSFKVLNVALLGASIGANALTITMEDMEKAIKEKVPEKFLELNRKALHYGYESARNNEKKGSAYSL